MTNSQGKTESPKSVADDLWSKPDETATNEKIKELCPIVITTIDCRPTKFKDANGDMIVAVVANVLKPCAACLGLPSLLYAINSPFPAFVFSM